MDLAARRMKCSSKNSAKRADLADGHVVRYSRTLAGRFRWIGGLDKPGTRCLIDG
jgi:hypothetical protein